MKFISPRLGTFETRRLKPAPKENESFYHSKEWRDFVGYVVRMRGHYCEDPACRAPDRGAGGMIFGDHIKELKDGGERFDPLNVLLRCGPCHNRKTAIERGKRARAQHGVGV